MRLQVFARVTRVVLSKGGAVLFWERLVSTHDNERQGMAESYLDQHEGNGDERDRNEGEGAAGPVDTKIVVHGRGEEGET